MFNKLIVNYPTPEKERGMLPSASKTVLTSPSSSDPEAVKEIQHGLLLSQPSLSAAAWIPRQWRSVEAFFRLQDCSLLNPVPVSQCFLSLRHVFIQKPSYSSYPNSKLEDPKEKEGRMP